MARYYVNSVRFLDDEMVSYPLLGLKAAERLGRLGHGQWSENCLPLICV